MQRLNWSNGAIKVSGFKEEIRLALKSSLLYGFQVSKNGERTCKHVTYSYEREQPQPSVPGALGDIQIETEASNKIKRVKHEIEVLEPTFENFHLRNVLFDPTLARQDVRKAKWVAFQIFPDIEGLDDFRRDPIYKGIPSDAEIRAYILDKKSQAPDALAGSKYQSYRENQAEKKTDTDTQADPNKAPIQVIEYIDEGSIVTILRLFADRSYVIRNVPNDGSVRAFSNAFIDVLGSAYGFGIGHLLRGEQRFQQGVLNSWVDQLALTLRPAWQRIGAPNGGQQNITISPGIVRNEQTELKPLLAPDVSMTAENALQASDNRASKRVGLSATDMPTQALRTGTGVQSFQAQIASKLEYFVEIFNDHVFIPAIEAFMETARKLSPRQINAILTAEEGKAFEGDPLDILNGQYRFDVLTSTKLAARKAAAQLIPTFVQLFSAEPVHDSLTQQNKKVNFGNMVDMTLELAGFPVTEIIEDMTDEDAKRAQMSNPAVIAAQSAQAQQQTDQQNKLEQIEEKGTATAGVAIVRSILKNGETDAAEQAQLGKQLLGGS
jgi:hypothetical protein